MFDLTLSFDNGPEPEVTPRVLDALAKHGIKTTFFVIGENCSIRNAATLRPERAPKATGSAIIPSPIPCRSACSAIPKQRNTRSRARKL